MFMSVVFPFLNLMENYYYYNQNENFVFTCKYMHGSQQIHQVEHS